MNSMQWKDLVPRSVCEGGKGWRGSHLEQEEMKEGNKKAQNRKQLCHYVTSSEACQTCRAPH